MTRRFGFTPIELLVIAIIAVRILPPDVPNLDTMVMGFMPAFNSPNQANSTACRVYLSTMVGPSDGAAAGGGPGAGCEQTPSTLAPGEIHRWPFDHRGYAHLADLTREEHARRRRAR